MFIDVLNRLINLNKDQNILGMKSNTKTESMHIPFVVTRAAADEEKRNTTAPMKRRGMRRRLRFSLDYREEKRRLKRRAKEETDFRLEEKRSEGCVKNEDALIECEE